MLDVFCGRVYCSGCVPLLPRLPLMLYHVLWLWGIVPRGNMLNLGDRPIYHLLKVICGYDYSIGTSFVACLEQLLCCRVRLQLPRVTFEVVQHLLWLVGVVPVV